MRVLGILRDLWGRPRDMDRFRAYVEQVKRGPGGDVFMPLVAANPMARPHMLAHLDALEAFDAERVVEAACAEAGRRLAASEVETRLALVPVDDVGGAWSERTLVDFDLRFGARKVARDYNYLTVPVYASETPDAALVRERVLAGAFRAAWVKRHGRAERVADMVRQEGRALRFAGAAGPTVPDVDAARAVLARHADATAHPTRFAAMYGDAAARRVGHAPLGLPDDAGFAVGLADARREKAAADPLA